MTESSRYHLLERSILNHSTGTDLGTRGKLCIRENDGFLKSKGRFTSAGSTQPVPNKGQIESGSESSKSERVAKYKEERRQQIAANLASAKLENDSMLESSYYLRYSQWSKQKHGNSHLAEENPSPKKEGIANGTDSVSGIASPKHNSALNQSSPVRRRFITRDSGTEDGSNIHSNIVRSTRASRLRAKANISMLENSPIKSDSSPKKDCIRNRNSFPSSDDGSHLSKGSPSHHCSTTDDLYDKITARSKDYESLKSGESSETSLSKSGEKLKDKSYKRKSSLNRVVVPEELQITHIDCGEDLFRRYRRGRRFSDSPSQNSGSERKGGSLALCPNVSLASYSREASCDSQNSQSDSKPSRPKETSSPKRFPLSNNPSNDYDSSWKTLAAIQRPEIPDCLLRNQQVKLNKGLASLDASRSRSQSLTNPSISSLRSYHVVGKCNDNVLRRSPPNSQWPLNSKQKDLENDTAARSSTSVQSHINYGVVRQRRESFEALQNNLQSKRHSESIQNSIPSVISSQSSFSNIWHSNSVHPNSICDTSRTECHSSDDVFLTPPESEQELASHSVEALNKDVVTSQPVIYTVTVKTTSRAFLRSASDSKDTNICPNLSTSQNFNGMRGEANSVNGDSNCVRNSLPPTLAQKHNFSAIPIHDINTTCIRNDAMDKNTDLSNNLYSIQKVLSHFENSSRLSTVTGKERRKSYPVSERQNLPVIKRKSIEEKKEEVHGILKATHNEDDMRRPHSILKKRGSSEEKEIPSKLSELHSILKKPIVDISEGSSSPEIHPILKNRNSEEGSLSDPKPILKKRSSIEEIVGEVYRSEPRPILKKKSSTDEEPDDRLKSILKLKRKSKDEAEISDNSLLGKTHVEVSEASIKSILKKLPSDEKEKSAVQLTSGESVSLHDSICSSKIKSEDGNNLTLKQETVPESFSFKPLSNIVTRTADKEDLEVLNKLETVSSSWQSTSSVLKKKNKSLSPNNSSDPELATPQCSSFQNLNVPLNINMPDLESYAANIKSRTCSDLQNDSAKKTVPKRTKRRFDHQNNNRYHTQPITLSERNETDSLESVQAFRALVLKTASFNVFEKLEKESESKTRQAIKTEYPQPYNAKIKNKSLRVRCRTLPVTIEEISEAEKIRSSSPKLLVVEKVRETSKVISMQESTSEVNRLEEMAPEVDTVKEVTCKASVRDSGSEDELSKMSVAAKASLFQQLEAKQKASTTSIPKLYGSRSKTSLRRFLPRSQTQPVTVEELHEASKIVEEETNTDKLPKTEKPQASDSEDDPSKLSLAEKMKLFNKKFTEDTFKPKTPAEMSSRRRSLASRFKTQPVTCEEVQKASKISPLAASLSQCDESETTNPLPNNSEQKLISGQVEDASYTKCIEAEVEDSKLLQSSNRNSKEDMDLKHKGILKTTKDNHLVEIRSILKTDTQRSDARDIKGILKSSEQEAFHSEKASLKGALKVEPEVKDIKPVLKPEINIVRKDSSDSSLSSEDDSDVEPSGLKTVLTCGKSHIVFNPLSPKQPRPPKERKILNPAVERRLMASLRKKERKIMHDMKSHELVTSASTSIIAMEAQRTVCMETQRTVAMESQQVKSSEVERRKLYPAQRSQTQPLTSDEKGLAGSPGGSIAERLAALKRSGEEDWKRRLSVTKTTEETDETLDIKAISTKLKDKLLQPSSIAERLTSLEEAQDQWRNRVEEKDATKFTVAGKMGQIPLTPQQSPLLDRKKHTPKPVKFRSNSANIKSILSNAVPVFPPTPFQISKTKSMPNALRKQSEGDSCSSMSEDDDDDDNATRVLVPKADNETFTSFFESVTSKHKEEKVDISEDALLEMSTSSHQLLSQKKTVRLQRRHVATRNPIKALASRTDLQQEYEEIRTGVADRELRRLKVEQLAKSSDMALSALAGLASTEDFKAIALKKSATRENVPLLPHRDVMLVQVKGRRHIQTRLVEPNAKLINHGDSYVLVTPAQVYFWIGEFSNVIERAKGSDVAFRIQSTKDLCFKGTSDVITIDKEKNPPATWVQSFLNILNGSEEDIQPAGPPTEDELYEANIIDTNMVYRVEKEELVPYSKYWGTLPKIEMLQPDQVLVFDYGSEMYVWHGKSASFDMRKAGYQLAKELWEQGYDYSECAVNPLSHTSEDKHTFKGSERPNWAVFAKINQHMEPVLFKEKFVDWPDMSRVIKVRGHNGEEKKTSESLPDLQPCDVKGMLFQQPGEPDMILEGSHLGRGLEYYDTLERRHFEITTLALKVWHILEYDHNLLPKESWGHFHSGDTYVVRWQYMITQTGRDLSGQVSRHSFVGRERCAYFFWQGFDSTITEKGASALMTVELDEERGPHVRVDQGKEPPSFLNLFEGCMVVCKGKREDESNRTGTWKFFMIRGELEQEAALVEIALGPHCLRSRSSFVLINIHTGIIFVWHGSKSPSHTRQAIKTAVTHLTEMKPQEIFSSDVNLIMNELQEGCECDEFWEGLGGKNNMYVSLLESSLSCDYTPRLFYLTSVSGTFAAQEVVCPFYSTKHICSFPFLQSDLYTAPQPALFLLDARHEVFIWQGWWPEGTEDGDNVATGSANVRWNVDRRCAMETALNYCQEMDSEEPPKAYLVSAGVEPAVFINLFPEWQQREDVSLLNIKDGKKPSEMPFIQEALAQLTRTQYSLKELQEESLPEGVDPSRLESYLTDSEFQETLGMNREAFYSLPLWKQSFLKKGASLF